MSATRTIIRGWLERGKAEGNRWLLVVSDKFNHENFPIYAPNDVAAVWKLYDEYDLKAMHSVIEVYDIAEDFETQLGLSRVFNMPERGAPTPSYPNLEKFIQEREAEMRKELSDFRDSVLKGSYKYTIAGAPIAAIDKLDWRRVFEAWQRRDKR